MPPEPTVMNSKDNEDNATRSFGYRNDRLVKEFFYKEPIVYSHEVYKKSSQIFTKLTEDDSHSSKDDILFDNENEMRLTYQLAYDTLKCKYLAEQRIKNRKINRIIIYLYLFLKKRFS